MQEEERRLIFNILCGKRLFYHAAFICDDKTEGNNSLIMKNKTMYSVWFSGKTTPSAGNDHLPAVGA